MTEPPHMRYFRRFPDHYYAKEPIIEHSKTRERIVIISMLAAAIVITMCFGVY